MLAMLDQLSNLADVTIDINKHRLRSHIAKMLAKIPAGKRPRADVGQACVEAELL